MNKIVKVKLEFEADEDMESVLIELAEKLPGRESIPVAIADEDPLRDAVHELVWDLINEGVSDEIRQILSGCQVSQETGKSSRVR